MADYTKESAIKKVTDGGCRVDVQKRTIQLPKPPHGAGIGTLGACDYLGKKYGFMTVKGGTA